MYDIDDNGAEDDYIDDIDYGYGGDDDNDDGGSSEWTICDDVRHVWKYEESNRSKQPWEHLAFLCGTIKL